MELYLTTGQVATILVADTDYVLRQVKAGYLPCDRRIPRRGGRTSYRFTPAEVRAYLEAYDRARLAALDAFLVPRGTSGQSTQSA